jgi:hypothetical protein
LRSLHAKACLRIEDRSRNGHLIHVLLPAEIPGLSRLTLKMPSIDSHRSISSQVVAMLQLSLRERMKPASTAFAHSLPKHVNLTT